MSDYTILGAGISGLSTGIKLLERGYSVTILERSDFVGGLASTAVRDGYRLDIGPHFITSQNNEVLREILGLFSEDELTSFSRSAKILFGKRFLDYPLTARNVLTQMGIRHAVSAAISYLWMAIRNLGPARPDAEANFENWAKNNFGNYLFKIFFKPYTEQFWGVHCNELSLDCVPLVTKMSFLKTLKMLFMRKFQRSSLSIAERETTLPLYYPRKGFGEVAIKLREKFTALDGSLKTSCEVSCLRSSDAGFRIKFRHDGKEQELNSSRLISTIPIPVMLGLLDPPAPEAVVSSAQKVNYLSVIVVYLVVGDLDVFDSSYLYLLGRPYNRISNIRRFCASLCPDDENIIACEMTCHFDDRTWKMSDDELTRLVINGMQEDGFLKDGDVNKSYVLRRRHAYPFYTVDYKDHLQAVRSYLNTIPGLISLGRTGGFKYMDIDQCIEDASTFVAAEAPPTPQH